MLTRDNDETDAYNEEALEYRRKAEQLIKNSKASHMKKEEQIKDL
jgi:hypothetical protein